VAFFMFQKRLKPVLCARIHDRPQAQLKQRGETS
jgi:hypothetical protein